MSLDPAKFPFWNRESATWEWNQSFIDSEIARLKMQIATKEAVKAEAELEANYKQSLEYIEDQARQQEAELMRQYRENLGKPPIRQDLTTEIQAIEREAKTMLRVLESDPLSESVPMLPRRERPADVSYANMDDDSRLSWWFYWIWLWILIDLGQLSFWLSRLLSRHN